MLPYEIIINITKYLSIKDKIKLARTCKFLNNIIHLQYSSLFRSLSESHKLLDNLGKIYLSNDSLQRHKMLLDAFEKLPLKQRNKCNII